MWRPACQRAVTSSVTEKCRYAGSRSSARRSLTVEPPQNPVNKNRRESLAYKWRHIKSRPNNDLDRGRYGNQSKVCPRLRRSTTGNHRKVYYHRPLSAGFGNGATAGGPARPYVFCGRGIGQARKLPVPNHPPAFGEWSDRGRRYGWIWDSASRIRVIPYSPTKPPAQRCWRVLV